MTDNGQTPHLVVDARAAGADVPAEFVEDGRIVLNVSYAATKNLVIGNDAITFEARFGGRACEVWIPATAVLAIYARETGEGMMFSDSSSTGDASADGATDTREASPAVDSGVDDLGDRPSGPDRPHLRVVK